MTESDTLRILPLAEYPKYREKAMEILRESFPENEVRDISTLTGFFPPSMDFKEWALVFGTHAVGYMTVLFTDEFAYFLYLAVAEECRGKGFGTAAMKFIGTEFASHCIFFSVETPSEKADNQEQRLARIRLYERLGYRISGIEIAGTDLAGNEMHYSIMCRGTADEKEIESIHTSLINSLSGVFSENVTITR
ncbi:MAG TPA: GNAT family N-acetyltransferase [Methanocorpusculum sp.]|nr:GNAT family N-acetyltransferase [Methanocorpusculum sp.]